VTQLEDALRDRPGARDAFVRALMPVVRARVLRVLRLRAPARLNESDDVVQTVWWVLWRDDARVLRAYSEARGASLEGYVGMVAEREAGHALQRVTALRRGTQSTSSLSADDAPEVASAQASPEATALARDQLSALGAHLSATLSARARLVLALLYVDGRSAEEAARCLGTPIQAVYTAQHQIRAAARAFLSAEARSG